MKIVETNITYEGLTFYDHQSRVLELPSWEEYCNLFRNYNGEAVGNKYKSVYSNLLGFVLPKNAIITELNIDEFHLTCGMNLWDDTPSHKLAYILEK